MLFILIEDNVFQFLTMSMELITVCVCTSPVEEQEFSYFIKEIGEPSRNLPGYKKYIC